MRRKKTEKTNENKKKVENEKLKREIEKKEKLINCSKQKKSDYRS